MIPFIFVIIALLGAGYASKKQQENAAANPPLPPSPASRTPNSQMVRAGQFQWRTDLIPTSRVVSDLAGVGGPQVYTPQGVRPDPNKLPPGTVAAPAYGGGGGGGGAPSGGYGGAGGHTGSPVGSRVPFLN